VRGATSALKAVTARARGCTRTKEIYGEGSLYYMYCTRPGAVLGCWLVPQTRKASQLSMQFACDLGPPLINNPAFASRDRRQRARVDVLDPPAPHPGHAPIHRDRRCLLPLRRPDGSGARQPEPLASCMTRSCMTSGRAPAARKPELPPVAYQIGTLHPTPFGGRQRPCSVEAAELKTSPLLRAESALCYSDHSTRNESAAAEKAWGGDSYVTGDGDDSAENGVLAGGVVRGWLTSEAR
jgi:hypothetical protein